MSFYAYLEKPSMVDFPRHFAAVFFTSGCNFTCGFCHNATLMGKKQTGLSREKIVATCDRFKKDWVNGVVITGGEPTLMPDLLEWIRFFKDEYGFDIKLDTNGSNPDVLEKCLPFVDYVAMDVKSGASLYPSFVGFKAIEKIERSIALLRAHTTEYEFRTTVIESIHTNEQMKEIQKMIQGAKRYVLQAFIPRDELPEKIYRELPRTSPARLHEIESLMAGCADEILLRGT